MKKLFTFVILLLLSLDSLAQSDRRIPYPILFVHGLDSDDQTWFNMLNQLKSQGLNIDIDYITRGAGTGSKVTFDLNTNFNDNNAKLYRSGPDYGDVFDFNSYINPNNDVFVISFESGYKNLSNQSAIVKQGFAVGKAVGKILKATGTDKIILFGHSMGGLAIREYLQNEINWPNSFSHQVAKLITTGTPHSGSNLSSANLLSFFTGKDERSEAVRDLRSYTNTPYLFGGFEASVPDSYYNKDIDCNGSQNDYIIGLNQKPIYTNLEYACIIGTGGNNPTLYGGSFGDDVVKVESADLIGLYDNKLSGETFYIDQRNQESGNPSEWTWHTKLPKQTFVNTYALDEPSDKNLAFEIKLNNQYRGFMTPHTKGMDDDYDADFFKFYIPQRGILTGTVPTGAGYYSELDKPNGKPLSFKGAATKLEDVGYYYLKIYGPTGKSSGYFYHFNTYDYGTNFCPLPALPIIENDGLTEICKGETVTLKLANSGYDSYSWFKDGVLVGSGKTFKVTDTGTYSVSGSKCSVLEASAIPTSITVKPSPAKPVISIAQVGIVSSALNGNQWFHNNMPIVNATGLTLLDVQGGGYSVIVTENGCSTASDPFTITGISYNSENLVIYPNPAKDVININSPFKGVVELNIFSTNGKMLRQNIYKEVNGYFTLDIRDLFSGLYVLELIHGKEIYTQQFLVK